MIQQCTQSIVAAMLLHAALISTSPSAGLTPSSFRHCMTCCASSVIKDHGDALHCSSLSSLFRALLCMDIPFPINHWTWTPLGFMLPSASNPKQTVLLAVLCLPTCFFISTFTKTPVPAGCDFTRCFLAGSTAAGDLDWLKRQEAGRQIAIFVLS